MCHYCTRTKQLADSLIKNPSRTSCDAPVIAYVHPWSAGAGEASCVCFSLSRSHVALALLCVFGSGIHHRRGRDDSEVHTLPGSSCIRACGRSLFPADVQRDWQLLERPFGRGSPAECAHEAVASVGGVGARLHRGVAADLL